MVYNGQKFLRENGKLKHDTKNITAAEQNTKNGASSSTIFSLTAHEQRSLVTNTAICSQLTAPCRNSPLTNTSHK